MSGTIYRFRPTQALLDGYHELERQEIYFAHPTELNDPLDGIKDVFWRGDRIVWSNLLSHYLLCLTQAVILAAIDRNNAKVVDEVSAFSIEGSLPSESAKEIYRRTKALFFNDQAIADLPTALASRRAPTLRYFCARFTRWYTRP